MRILYGVTGEGLGHAMRSRVLLDLLRADGHDVLVAASARAATYLGARGHRVVTIDGFSLQYADDSISPRPHPPPPLHRWRGGVKP